MPNNQMEHSTCKTAARTAQRGDRPKSRGERMKMCFTHSMKKREGKPEHWDSGNRGRAYAARPPILTGQKKPRLLNKPLNKSSNSSITEVSHTAYKNAQIRIAAHHGLRRPKDVHRHENAPAHALTGQETGGPGGNP